MKFSDPCNILSADGQPVDVWLEAGREGRVFTYRADPDLRLQPGDLVRVPLRNRTMHGLVVGCPVQAMPADRQAALQPVEALKQGCRSQHRVQSAGDAPGLDGER